MAPEATLIAYKEPLARGRSLPRRLHSRHRVDNTLVDLRIQLADPAGNVLTWTQERAIVIGNVTAPDNPKRRSVR